MMNPRFCYTEGKDTPGNKLNFLLYDSEYLYGHKNEPGTMYRKIIPGAVIISTLPLDNEHWEEVPQNQLIVYKDGKIVYEAEPHKNTYIHNEENMRFLYLDHATL